MRASILFSPLFLVLFFCFSQITSAQYIEKKVLMPSEVPVKIITAFQNDFPTGKAVEWHKIGATSFDVIMKFEKKSWLVSYDWEGRKGAMYQKSKKSKLGKEKKQKLTKKYEGLKITAIYIFDSENQTYVVEGKMKGKLVQFKI